MMDTIIKTEKVTKVFNPGMPDEMKAINRVSIEIKKREMVVLKGPSGSGKTSLLSLIGCMSRPTEGRIIIMGKDVAKLPERFLADIRRKTFGFVFQQFNLISDTSAIENVMLPLYPTNTGLFTIRKKAELLLERLGLLKKKNFKIQRLSVGEQQRIAIARALINEPEIILADEPTTHLDTTLSEEVLDILGTLNRDGKTIIIATHDPLVHDAAFVDRLIEIRDGAVREIKAK